MKRDLSLDVLRGIMLVIMAADHFGEPVFKLLYEFAGYVTAAEGFVFLSGMLVALVYSRYHTAGGQVLERKVWRRAGVIYGYHLLVLLAVFVFTVATDLSGAYWKSFATEMQAEPVRGLLSGMLLVYQPPMLDILPLYVMLMLAAPFALRLMLQYQGIGVAMVLSGSVILWIAALNGWGRVLLGLLPEMVLVRVGAFDYLAWQLIFVLGLALGYLRFAWQDNPPRINKMLFVACLGSVIYLYLLRHGHVHQAWLAQYQHIARDDIGWLRLLNFLAFVYVIAGLVRFHRHYGIFKPLAWPGRWLAFLGQHSLQVFAYHLVVLYCYIPFRWGEWALTTGQKWLLLPVFLASLSLPALWHRWHQQSRNSAPKVDSTPQPA